MFVFVCVLVVVVCCCVCVRVLLPICFVLFVAVAAVVAAQNSMSCFLSTIADGHTVLNTPDLFRPPKLSSTGPG